MENRNYKNENIDRKCLNIMRKNQFLKGLKIFKNQG